MRKIINKFSFPGLLSRILNKQNINKILIVFIVGLTSRILVNCIYNVNVFTDYFNTISIIYYMLMSIFIVLIHEIITLFDINIIPYSTFNNIKINFINIKIFGGVKLKDLTVSSIRNLLKETSFDNKLPMTRNESNNFIINKRTISDNAFNSNFNSNIKNNSPNISNNVERSNSSVSSEHNYTDNRRNNRLNVNNRTNNGVDNNTVRSNESNNLNNPSSQSNWQGHRVYNDDVYINLDRVVSFVTNYNNSTVPRTPPPAPNPYSNLTTPSTSGPSENFDNNSPRRSTDSTYQSQPVDTSETTNNTNGYSNVDSSYRDSYRLQNTVYVPNSTQPAIPFRPAPVIAPVTASAQYYNGPILSEPYQNLPDANQFAVAATYTPINTDSNQVPVTRALINNPKPEQRYTTVNNVNWDRLRNQVEDNFDWAGYSDKEVVIPDKGIKGKLKVCFRYLDEKMHSADSIYVTYKDKSKRKFIWTLWESKSGNYESYKDFKESWDPKTSIFKEIKNRTRKDMRADIEAIIGVNRNTRGILGNTMQNRIEPLSNKTTTREVINLVRDNDPFNNHTSSVNDSARIHNNNATNSSNIGDSETRHKRKHSHSSSNDSSNDSSNHSSNHNHGHRHKRSHGHGKSRNYERRRK